MDGWTVGRKRDGWTDGRYKLWTPSNSLTTALIQSLIHSLRTHPLILAPQSPSGQGRARGLH